jgi:predicted NAD/FAD-dependent oxidoreductase
MATLCIVGAGAAGLAAAHALRDSALRVTVIDKSRGLSGRAATRWRDVEAADGAVQRWRYDHGAQYVSPPPGSAAHRLVRDLLPAHDLVDIARPVWPFDDDGTLRPDRARTDDAPRWTYPDGLAELGRRLAAATPGLDLRRQAHAERFAHGPGGWRVHTRDGERLGPFDALLLTPPAPQAADLLSTSEMDTHRRDALVETLRGGTYRSQFSVMLGFTEAVARPEAYGLVNAPASGEPGQHDIAWLAFESDKPGRAPEGATLLIAQMSPAWTRAHYDDPQADVVAAARASVETLLGPLPAPAWTDTQRWRYALPDAPLDTAPLDDAADLGLFFAGDATAGRGRVHLALEEGLRVAERIRGTRDGG